MKVKESDPSIIQNGVMLSIIAHYILVLATYLLEERILALLRSEVEFDRLAYRYFSPISKKIMEKVDYCSKPSYYCRTHILSHS